MNKLALAALFVIAAGSAFGQITKNSPTHFSLIVGSYVTVSAGSAASATPSDLSGSGDVFQTFNVASNDKIGWGASIGAASYTGGTAPTNQAVTTSISAKTGSGGPGSGTCTVDYHWSTDFHSAPGTYTWHATLTVMNN